MKKFTKRFHFDIKEVSAIFLLFLFVAVLMFTFGVMIGKGFKKTEEIKKAENFGNNIFTNLISNSSSSNANNQPTSLNKLSNNKSKIENLSASGMEKSTKDKIPTKVNVNVSIESNNNTSAENKGGKEILTVQNIDAEKHKKESRLRSIASQARKLSEGMKPATTKLFEDIPPVKLEKKKEEIKRQIASTEPLGKFIIQTNAYNNKKEAEERVKELQKRGFRAFYIPVNIPDNLPFNSRLPDSSEAGKHVWYRVSIGYFPSIQAATNYGKELKRKEADIETFVVRKIKK